MRQIVHVVLGFFICTVLLCVAPSMAYTLNGKSWAHLSKPRKPVFIICDAGIDAAAKVVIAGAAAIWTNGEKFEISFDETKQCNTNANWNKCDKINVIDFGPIDKGVALAAPCAGNMPTKMQTCDIRISDAVALYTGTGTVPKDKYDLFTAIAHEFGHCLGLGEVQTSADKTSVMYFELGPGEKRRVLSKDDMAGREALYK